MNSLEVLPPASHVPGKDSGTCGTSGAWSSSSSCIAGDFPSVPAAHATVACQALYCCALRRAPTLSPPPVTLCFLPTATECPSVAAVSREPRPTGFDNCICDSMAATSSEEWPPGNTGAVCSILCIRWSDFCVSKRGSDNSGTIRMRGMLNHRYCGGLWAVFAPFLAGMMMRSAVPRAE